MVDLLGRNITYLRLSVTDLCNLRCRYCMPPEGVPKRSHSDMLTEDETVLAVETAASLGVRKLRITGGEPLVKKNILALCSRCSRVSGIEEMGLTTNATLLAPMSKYSFENQDTMLLNLLVQFLMLLSFIIPPHYLL